MSMGANPSAPSGGRRVSEQQGVGMGSREGFFAPLFFPLLEVDWKSKEKSKGK